MQLPVPMLREELDHVVGTVCKALNDPKRLLVMYVLKDGPRTVTELCEALDCPQSNASQHLAMLRDRGLVEADRQGNNVVYSLRHPKLLEAVEILREVMADELNRQQALRAGRRAGEFCA